MEQKKSRILRITAILTLLLFVGHIPPAEAQTYQNDKSKLYQIRSMENGTWKFQPGLYYMTLHKSYSGAYWKGLNIKFKVNKSKTGQLAPLRAAQLATEQITSDLVQNQIDSIKPLAEEESLRAAERMIDTAYPIYKEKFDGLLKNINEMLLGTNSLSEGELAVDAAALLEERDLLKDEIDYIHQQGPTAQMEQAKRELAYEEALKKLGNLAQKSYNLLYYAQTLYNLKH